MDDLTICATSAVVWGWFSSQLWKIEIEEMVEERFATTVVHLLKDGRWPITIHVGNVFLRNPTASRVLQTAPSLRTSDFGSPGR